jgi:hypothetical protein
MSQVSGMQGCNCTRWKVAIREIVTVFMKADAAGIKYHGAPWIYCPWCGSSLVDITKFEKDKVLFFKQGQR